MYLYGFLEKGFDFASESHKSTALMVMPPTTWATTSGSSCCSAIYYGICSLSIASCARGTNSTFFPFHMGKRDSFRFRRGKRIARKGVKGAGSPKLRFSCLFQIETERTMRIPHERVHERSGFGSSLT